MMMGVSMTVTYGCSVTQVLGRFDRPSVSILKVRMSSPTQVSCDTKSNYLDDMQRSDRDLLCAQRPSGGNVD